MILRMLPDSLSFDLELYDRDHLVHLGREIRRDRVIFVCFKYIRSEVLARIVLVYKLCQRRERTQVETVSYFEHVEVVIADIYPYHSRYAWSVSACSAHPQYIVVAPLNVYAPVLHQVVHDDMGLRASVEDVSDDVKPVDGKVADGLSHIVYELSCSAVLDDGIDDLIIVSVSVCDIVGKQKLVHDV